MPAPLSFVVITGLSGAGKSYAIKCFEDMGFFCVDNLPTTLIPTFADLIMRSEQPIHRVALGVDVREGAYLSRLFYTIRELRARGHSVEVLFLEASEESLVRRYHETRRRHPWTPRTRPPPNTHGCASVSRSWKRACWRKHPKRNTTAFP